MMLVVAALLLLAVASADRAEDILNSMTLSEKIDITHGHLAAGLYTGNTPANERLGIPSIKLNDGPQGFRKSLGLLPINLINASTQTAFPTGVTVAATWDPALALEWGDALGEEFKGKGANVQLGPGMNLARVPECGRNFEYMGEDGFLAGAMVGPTVKGIQQNGVIANAKHFVVNNQEEARTSVNVNVDRRTLFEVYYPAFRAAVEAGVGSVMCSYNLVNGVPACASPELMIDDLKGKMGFKGWVMTDWFASLDGMHESTPEDLAKSGLDQEMPYGFHAAGMQEAVERGELDEAVVDDKVLRILRTMIEVKDEATGRSVLDDVDPASEGRTTRANVSTAAHDDVARRIAAAATVLLQNHRALLPLDPTLRIALVGDKALNDVVISGAGSGNIEPSYVVTPLEGIRRRASNVTHVPSAAGPAAAAEAAAAADVTVVFVGTRSGEFADRPTLALGEEDLGLIAAVAAAVGPDRVVVSAATPGALLTPWRVDVGAVICTFIAGQQAGNAVADVLFGDVNPSGRLPLTFPNVDNEVQFTREQYPGVPVEEGVTDRTLESYYTEKLLVGYKWYDAHPEVEPAFEFGFGLSYSSFEYGPATLSARSVAAPPDLAETDPDVVVLTVSLTVTNVGAERAGAEVAQLYLTFPSEAGEPVKNLRGFAKTAVLAPGASELVSFELRARDLAIFDDDEAVDAWRVLPGEYGVGVGASSRDIRAAEEFDVEA